MLEDSRLDNLHVSSNYDAIFSLEGSWVDNPFVIKNSSRDKILAKPLPSMKSIHFGAGVYLKPWFMLGLTTGYNFFSWKTVDQTSYDQTNSGSSSGFGDIELKTKIRIIREPKWAFSIMPLATIPTGSGEFDPVSGDSVTKNAFLSDKQIGFGGKILAEYHFNFIQVVANLGYKHNSGAKYLDLDYRDMLYTGIGTYIAFTQKFGLNAEFVRQWALPISDKTNPNEFYLGASAGLTRSLRAFAGVGLGNLFQKADGNSFRASAGIKFTPNLWGKKKEHVKVVSPEVVNEAIAENPKSVTPVVKNKTHYIFNNTSNAAVVRFPHNSSKLLLNKNSPFSWALNEIIKNNL